MSELIGYIPILLWSSLLTFSLAIVSLGFATLMGALGAMGKLSTGPIGRENAAVYTSIIRGIPDLVLIILIYFGFQGMVNALTDRMGFGIFDISTFWAGVVALGFIYGAYLTETFRGAFLAVPRGQTEAACALGMGKYARFFNVILPQLIRHAIPGFGNVFQVLIKSTAVLSVIGFEDLVGIANDAGKTTREPFIFLLFVLVMYLIFYYFVGVVFAWLERKFAEVGH